MVPCTRRFVTKTGGDVVDGMKCNLRRIMYEQDIKTIAEVIRLTGVNNRQALTRMYRNRELERVEVMTYIKVCQALKCSLGEILEFPA